MYANVDKGHSTAKKRTSDKNNERNVCCRHGTNPWSKCSQNPKSKNYHMNPHSPSDRENGGRGRGQARGQVKGQGNDFKGRGGASQHNTTHHSGSRGDNH